MTELGWTMLWVVGSLLLGTMWSVARLIDGMKQGQLDLQRRLDVAEADRDRNRTRLMAICAWMEKRADHCTACGVRFAPSGLTPRYAATGEARFLCNSCLHTGGQAH